jgi:hypothetical protein
MERFSAGRSGVRVILNLPSVTLAGIRKALSPKSSYIFQIGQDKLQSLDFDAIFNFCTNFGACETLQIFEDLFGVPVVTSNQAFV